MIAIVADSTAYITRKEAQKYNFTIIPMSYTAREHTFHETYVDANGSFERMIAENYGNCTTSQPSLAAFMSTFDELLRHGHSVLCLTISSRLSGAYSSASTAARQIGGGKIMVVDSLVTAGGLYMLMRKARELAEQNLSLSEIANAIESMREKVETIFSVDDMVPLRKSGRLGIVKQSVGTILNVRPILKCAQGAVVSGGNARGKNEQIRRMVEKIPADASHVIVHYLTNVNLARDLQSDIKRKLPDADIELRRVGPVLGIHLGLGVVGTVWMYSQSS